MRHLLTLLFLIVLAAHATAADPTTDAAKSGNQYAAALQKTAALLAKVKDEATAEEARPKLDKLHEEARDARRDLFKALAEVDVRDDGELVDSMVVMWKNVRQVYDPIVAEFDRIGSDKNKAVYKVLRETKLFAALEKEYENRARNGAEMLMIYARTYSVRNDGKAFKLEDLATYSETGKKALTDPWGFPYQLLAKPGKGGVNSTHIWTVSPYTGKKLGNPPPDEK